jgi:hypothetical protein
LIGAASYRLSTAIDYEGTRFILSIPLDTIHARTTAYTATIAVVIYQSTMPLKRGRKRAAAAASSSSKRQRSGDTSSQAITVDTQVTLPTLPTHLSRSSPRRALANSQAIPSSPTFESQLRDDMDEDALAKPTEGSNAATIATTEASIDDALELHAGSFADNVEGLN